MGTVQLHRVLSAPPERVFKAFLNPEALSKWLPPHGFTGQVHSMDARVGGGYKMSFTNFTTGSSHSFGVKYVEIIENKRIKHTDRFDDPNLPGDMQVTITFEKVNCGTDIKIIQEGISASLNFKQRKPNLPQSSCCRQILRCRRFQPSHCFPRRIQNGQQRSRN